jgi:hypothetical protein
MNSQMMLFGSLTETFALIGLGLAGFIALIVGWIIHPYTVGEFTRWVDSPYRQFMARIGTSVSAAIITPTAIAALMMGDKSPGSNQEKDYQPSSIKASAIESSAIGNWQINIERSLLDGSKTVKGSRDADSLVKIGHKTERPVLVILHKDGELKAHIAFQSFLGTDSTDVTTRFGKNAPTTESWGISTDNKTLLVPGEGAAFVDKLKSYETLVVRVTPPSEGPVTLSFTTAGLKAVLDAIKEESSTAAAAQTTDSSDKTDDLFLESRPSSSVVTRRSMPSVAQVEQSTTVRPTDKSIVSRETPKTVSREVPATLASPEIVDTLKKKTSSKLDSDRIKIKTNSVQIKIAELKGELAALEAKIETERDRWQESVNMINRLTNFKKTPVRQGSPQYHQCMAASRIIKEVETGAVSLKAEKARLEAMIQSFESK